MSFRQIGLRPTAIELVRYPEVPSSRDVAWSYQNNNSVRLYRSFWNPLVSWPWNHENG